MTQASGKTNPRKWIRWGFLTWAVVSTAWMLNSFRTDPFPSSWLDATPLVAVTDGVGVLALEPVAGRTTGLIFISGAGPAAEAYVPLLRPLAEQGTPVFIVRLPWRMAPLERHKAQALERVQSVMTNHPTVDQWVVGGHSAGGKLAARFARQHADDMAALLLVATTHPRDFDLSSLDIPVTKIFGTRDEVAPVGKVERNAALLPGHAEFIAIEGGNHAQFGHYGPQFMDGKPDISRERQQALALEAIRLMLERLLPPG